MQRVTLQSDEAHVWKAVLTPGPDIHCLSQLLSRDECTRADSFRFARDRDRYILSHAFLRMVLGRYLGMDPRTLVFSRAPHGKPALAGEHGAALCFNLSHSHELAVLTIAVGYEVGVDVEYVRPGLDWQQVAEEFFSPDEAAALRSLPRERLLEAFYTCWTRKEAYLKARGDGLSFPLNQVRVSPPDAPAALLSVGGEPAAAARWSLYDLTPAPGYVGALAVEGPRLHLHMWRWPEN